MKLPDSKLIANYQNGDEQALATLIERHQRELFSFIFYKVLDEELAKLKSYDYVAWQEENEKVAELNKRLNLSDKLQMGNLATEYVFSSGAELKYHNFDEFDKLFTNNRNLF